MLCVCFFVVCVCVCVCVCACVCACSLLHMVDSIFCMLCIVMVMDQAYGI